MTTRALLSKLFPNAPLPDGEITTLTDNTARATAQSVFVCIKGVRFDGHALAEQAYANGCRIFVAEHALALPADATVLITPSTRRALALLACRFYGEPSQKLHVIGITGTKGKTTTALLISHVLNQNGIPCGYIGTNGIAYGDVTQKTLNTTPDPITLQATLCDMVRAGMRAVVIEVSSQALMQARADGTHFETVLFTNLAPDHVGPREHASFEDYAACKKRLFTEFDAKNAIWYTDDAHTAYMRADCQIPRQLDCSVDGKTEFTATDVAPFRTKDRAGIAFSYTANGKKTPVHLNLVGRCNVSNALFAAVTATEIFGISPESTATAIASCAVAGRSEWFSLPIGAAAVIDYAHNGESLRQILNSLREYTAGRLICLFGSVGERSQLRRADLGAVAGELADFCILTSDNPGTESPDAIIADIAAALKPYGTPYCSIPDRRDAIEHALSVVQCGDVLLLAGKGHEEYQLIGREKLPFSEKAILAAHIAKYATVT